MLEASEQEYFLAESLNSDGSRSECLTYGHSGLHSPFSNQENADSFLKMDGRAVFDFAIRDVAKSIKQTIEESPVEATDLDYLLLHQANDRILDKMARKNRCRPRQTSSQYDGIWQYQCSKYPDFTFRVCRTKVSSV